jgi:hypothetical protein
MEHSHRNIQSPGGPMHKPTKRVRRSPRAQPGRPLGNPLPGKALAEAAYDAGVPKGVGNTRSDSQRAGRPLRVRGGARRSIGCLPSCPDAFDARPVQGEGRHGRCDARRSGRPEAAIDDRTTRHRGQVRDHRQAPRGQIERCRLEPPLMHSVAIDERAFTNPNGKRAPDCLGLPGADWTDRRSGTHKLSLAGHCRASGQTR